MNCCFSNIKTELELEFQTLKISYGTALRIPRTRPLMALLLRSTSLLIAGMFLLVLVALPLFRPARQEKLTEPSIFSSLQGPVLKMFGAVLRAFVVYFPVGSVNFDLPGRSHKQAGWCLILGYRRRCLTELLPS